MYLERNFVKLETKAQLSKVTLSLLTFVAFVFLLGILVLVLCAGLQINPFRETTSEFLVASFIGLIGIALILVLLNVATNISLIADARISELEIKRDATSLYKLGLAFLAATIILVGVVFVGTYTSKERFLTVVRSQADEVLKENDALLGEVSMLFESAKPADYRKIYDIRDFLANQRRDLPQLTLIYSGKFEDKMAFFEIRQYFPGNVDENRYSPQYFNCTKNLDCDYLRKFFSGERVDILQQYTLRDDQFYIYIPYIGKTERFILLFERRNSYGKLGS
jgi:hypothetical protein